MTSRVVGCTLILAWTLSAPAEEWAVLEGPWEGAPSAEMMPRWLLNRVEEADQRWLARYEERTEPDEIREYQKRMRETFLEQIGGLPEQTPLNPKVTGRIEQDGFVVEKILFESQPQHYVTAALFLPDADRFSRPCPGVLVPCGHSSNGRASEAYLLGLSYVGLRAEDLLVCARLAAAEAGDAGKVDLVAVGHVGVPALHAAALEADLFGQVTLRRSLTSWANLIELGASHDQLANAVHGALQVYDLPDLAQSLGDQLTITEPLDAIGRPHNPGR